MLMPLLLSLATITFAQPVDSYPAQAMWADLDVTAPVPNCNNFTVDIYINLTAAGMSSGANGMWAWEFKLYYESDKLNATGYTDNLPDASWDSPNSVVAGAGIEYGFNATHDRIHRAVSALPFVSPFPTAFVGVMSVCTIDFHVIYEGAQYDAPLIFAKKYGFDANLGDDTGEVIVFTAYDNTVPVVPEFPVALIMPIFMLATLVVVILGKTAWSRKRMSDIVVR